MNDNSVFQTEEKLKQMEQKLVGHWAKDTWEFAKRKRHYIRFEVKSPSLRTELKYALMSQFECGHRSRDSDQKELCRYMSWIIKWLDCFTPPIHSLLVKSLQQWEDSLRSYLLQRKRLKSTHQKHLNSNQEYSEYIGQDKRISLLRQLYSSIYEVYDDRPETEKDVWDMRRLGLEVNLSAGIFKLNFSLIAQPWLRHLAKLYMKYRIAVRSPGNCYEDISDIRRFSLFLEERYPKACAADIDRSLVVEYIIFLRERGLSEGTRRCTLGSLRLFLETCAYYLHIEELPTEQLIFDSDLPKDKETPSREIPQEVLRQIRNNLETLPTITLRMVVILRECGMRISELCTLPADCLICDDRHDWYLQFYQGKSKREHIIPLIDKRVIGTIQAQQQEIREHWGKTCPYLFPSLKSPTLPFRAATFLESLNWWAVEKDIRDASGKLYHFQTHQFRHTVGMRLLDTGISLDVISRLLGHQRLDSTQVYARRRDADIRKELERDAQKRKTVDGQGQTVASNTVASNSADRMSRQGMRGQTLPVGGCGRPTVEGECKHANKCLTCPFWLTSTEDLPRLRAFYNNALKLRQRAGEVGNQIVVRNQDSIIAKLAVRIAKLEDTSMDGSLSVEELLSQFRTELAEVESALEEAREAGLFVAVKRLELIVLDLKANITGLEGTL